MKLDRGLCHRIRRRLMKIQKGLKTISSQAAWLDDVLLAIEAEQLRGPTKRSSPCAHTLFGAAQDDGSVLVSIDGRKVRMTGPYWGLLKQLSADSGWSLDECVGWKSRSAVLKGLAKDVHKELSPGNLSTMLWRLQDMLTEHRLDSNLIERNRSGGLVRFRLVRAPRPSVVPSYDRNSGGA